MKKIEQFFCYCSGASLTVLKRCPTETSKYVGIGAAIFFTGLLAAISSAYALNFVFDNIFIAIGFGLVWGIMIFNLDRFIVLSMRKGNGRSEYWQALPRFLLAILIALVISKPLELKVFETEIEAELVLLKQELLLENQKSIARRFDRQLDSLQNEKSRLSANILNKEKKRDELLEIARQEADGTGGSGKVNPGPIYRIKKDNADRVQKELEELKVASALVSDQIESEMQALSKARDVEISTSKIEETKGIFFQMAALNRLGEKYAMIYYADWFIILLFIVLETSPILVKILSPRGPYDDLLEVHEKNFEGYRKEKVHKEEKRVEQIIIPQTN